jgi:hypothetical protein
MLNYTVTGPHAPDSRYLAVYPTPGLEPICAYWSEDKEKREADRLSREQAGRQDAVQIRRNYAHG